MLLKLIKYDIKSTYAKLLLTFLVFLIVCIVAPLLLVQFQRTAAFVYVGFTGALGCMAMIVLVFIFLFQRYHSNLYSNEGYLMFSLPTDGKRLLASKLIVAVLWFVLGTAFLAGGIAAIVYVFSFEPDFTKYFVKLFSSFEFNFNTVSCTFVSYFIGTILFFLEIYFSISVSKLPLWRKFGVLMGFVTYFVVNLLQSIPSLLCNGLDSFNSGFKAGITYSYSAGNNTGLNVGKTMSKACSWSNEWPNFLICAIFCVALFIATTWLLDKKTSLK